jgi:citrate lyase beta subunit
VSCESTNVISTANGYARPLRLRLGGSHLTVHYRSLLFTPGTAREKLHKSLETTADALIWDLEDAVHPSEKDKARSTVRDVLDSFDKPHRRPIFLRVNAVGTPWFEADTKLATHRAVRGVVLPKAEDAEHIEAARALANEAEIIAIIETARGLRNLEHTLESGHVSGVALGALDLAVDLGLTLTESGLELLYSRSRIATLARAASVEGIYDSVFPDLESTSTLRRQAESVKNLGFTGQLAIHPSQLEIIHTVYSPSQQEIEWATRVLQAADSSERNVLGVFILDGQMIDRPVMEQARRVYEVARRFELTPVDQEADKIE